MQRLLKFQFDEDWLITFTGLALVILPVVVFPLPAPSYKWSDLVSTHYSVFAIVGQGLLACGVWLVIARLTNRNGRSSLLAFAFVWSVGQLALAMAGAAWARALGLEAVIFSLLIGLILGQVMRVPAGWRQVMSSETWVKIGLVMLGASVIFSDLLKAGGLGLLQAAVVVIAVWYAAFYIARFFGLEEDLKLMIASAVSICGVSAAIATAGAIQGDSKKLSLVVSMVLMVAIPMMLGMPYLARYLELSDAVTGAWLGGTIDTTGAVVAAGSLAGETALQMSTIVKFSQNVLLGVAAFAISFYWAYSQRHQSKERPTLNVIWQRFPKFVIGFVVASFVFSVLVEPATLTTVKDGLKSLQTLWFVMAFVAIGLETNLHDLFRLENRNALYTFLLAQAINILLTLGISVMLFS